MGIFRNVWMAARWNVALLHGTVAVLPLIVLRTPIGKVHFGSGRSPSKRCLNDHVRAPGHVEDKNSKSSETEGPERVEQDPEDLEPRLLFGSFWA